MLVLNMYYLDWFIKKEKFTSIFEIFFSCFEHFWVWGMTTMITVSLTTALHWWISSVMMMMVKIPMPTISLTKLMTITICLSGGYVLKSCPSISIPWITQYIFGIMYCCKFTLSSAMPNYFCLLCVFFLIFSHCSNIYGV